MPTASVWLKGASSQPHSKPCRKDSRNLVHQQLSVCALPSSTAVTLFELLTKYINSWFNLSSKILFVLHMWTELILKTSMKKKSEKFSVVGFVCFALLSEMQSQFITLPSILELWIFPPQPLVCYNFKCVCVCYHNIQTFPRQIIII